MNLMTEILNAIRDTKGYLLLLKDTGVEEINVTSLSQRHTKGDENVDRMEHKIQQLQNLREKIGDCKRCKLWKGRTNIVFGTGNPDSPMMFVGEGPGEEEDRRGAPFVGKAGELLTKMIEAMGLVRDDVYIANVVKCRPPNNRNPEEDEIAACKPFLDEQINIIKPRVICALGTFVSQTLLDTKTKISELRGKVHEKGGDRIAPTFHPAYLLRNQQQKGLAWKDLQLVMKELGLNKVSREM